MNSPNTIIEKSLKEQIDQFNEFYMDSVNQLILDQHRVDQVYGYYDCVVKYDNTYKELTINGTIYNDVEVFFAVKSQSTPLKAIIDYSIKEIEFMNSRELKFKMENDQFKITKAYDKEGNEIENLDEDELKEQILNEDNIIETKLNSIVRPEDRVELNEKIDEKELLSTLTQIQSPLQVVDNATKKSIINQIKKDLSQQFNRELENQVVDFNIGILKNSGHLVVQDITVNKIEIANVVLLFDKNTYYIEDGVLQDQGAVSNALRQIAEKSYHSFIHSSKFIDSLQNQIGEQVSNIRDHISEVAKDIRIDDFRAKSNPERIDKDKYETALKTNLIYRFNNSELFTWLTRVELSIKLTSEMIHGKMVHQIKEAKLNDYEINDEETSREISKPVTDTDLENRNKEVTDLALSEEEDLREKAHTTMKENLSKIKDHLQNYKQDSKF